MKHGNAGKKRLNTKTDAAIVWMDRYFNLIGGKMPDKDQIHLPCWENQKDIYHRYCSDLKARGSMGKELLGISFMKSGMIISQMWLFQRYVCKLLFSFC